VLWCNHQFIDTGTMIYVLLHLLAAASTGAVVYFTASWTLWHLSGRPPGPEATAMAALSKQSQNS
jgi:hypothetical protein